MVLARIFFGGAFTIATAYSLGRVFVRRIGGPPAMALPVGGAILSTCVFLLLLAGRANDRSFLVLGICAIVSGAWIARPRFPRRPNFHPRHLILAVIFCAYGVLYLVHTLAPEIQPDAAGYHLGLAAEYFRLEAFPGRIGFYEILPQGMEMLYLFAFAFGEHSAAKLVHFAFLVATVPALVAVGRRLGIDGTVCWIAAALYWCVPVVGVSGTCAYTDAALVCCILATLYFLLGWRQDRETKYLIPAGLLAGFCYAIKLNALLIPTLAVLFVLIELRHQPRQALARAGLLAGAAAVTIAPWMIRSFALTGNPFAPLFNAWFPNPYFLAVVERNLANTFRTYEGFTFHNAPWELTMGGASQGIVGPLFLLLPIGLLALRRSAGRWLWVAGGLLAIPWFINVGTRFLMPSLPFFALALALALPRPAAWAALVFHAISSWPAVMAQYERPGLWRLQGFPWEAALRVQPETDYLRIALPDYAVAEMLSRKTRPNARILGLAAAPHAYLDREIVQFWESAQGVRAREELLEAWYAAEYPFHDWTASWPRQPLRGLRVRNLAKSPYDWEIHEADILLAGGRIRVGPEWRAAAFPNLFEARFALDGNQASRWRTWEPARPGMFLEVEFGIPETVSGISFSTHWPAPQVEIFGKALDGRWMLLANNAQVEIRPKENLRRAAILSLKRAGIGYILAPVEGAAGNGPLGKDLLNHAKEWGIVEAGGYRSIRVFGL